MVRISRRYNHVKRQKLKTKNIHVVSGASDCKSCFCKLNPWAFGIAFALVWVFSLLITIIASFFSDFAINWINWLANFYNVFIPGTTPTLAVFFGLIDCFVFGVLVAWIYNVFAFPKH